MKLLKYKNLSGSYTFDSRDNVYIGKILGIEGFFSFFGDTEEEAIQDFREACKCYLEYSEPSVKD
ncbi:hypothetical protein PEPNEM18_01534 [Aedoeadaptatus nemausensis]|uniref:HicB family n=1 Tax=Aedoeadaptatus nemausensis TaxID=2582829 RepID=A0A6V6Y6W8_9FIRM|nr:hypothetical protein [Peptoniphilus nemausensis]CAC9935536.1 hypothetical protein PEPNEM18_01534 [Peptoniphilus nemausensis]